MDQFSNSTIIWLGILFIILFALLMLVWYVYNLQKAGSRKL